MSYQKMLLDTFSKNLLFQQYKHFHRECMKLTSEANTKSTLKMDLNSRRREFLSRGKVTKQIRTNPGTGIVCKSQKLFYQNDILYPAYPGAFHYMPNGLRALEKLIKIIDEEMRNMGALKVSMPTMMEKRLWRRTGRWENKELFRVQDRHKKHFCLGPTHEESITSMLAENRNLSYQNFPIMLYQITRKFRDEMHAKNALLRSREFEMKDLYTFDLSIENAKETYELVCNSYDRIFDRLGLPFIKVVGATGNIGGVMSHEYHLPADIGEDTLYTCDNCGFGTNAELLSPGPTPASESEEKRDSEESIKATDQEEGGDLKEENIKTTAQEEKIEHICPSCNAVLEKKGGIEVGHAFLLGRKYSKVFDMRYKPSEGTGEICEMGCYGLGVSRILQASVEVLSNEEEITWPSLIAPQQICIIPQQQGYAYEQTFSLAVNLNDRLTDIPSLKNEVVIDDRSQYSIGGRVGIAKRKGIPYIICTGKKALESPALFEVIDVAKDETSFLTFEQVVDKLSAVETVQV